MLTITSTGSTNLRRCKDATGATDDASAFEEKEGPPTPRAPRGRFGIILLYALNAKHYRHCDVGKVYL
jgi:hypothetical protein